MSRLKVKLTRNLRRSIMRGHPWIYRDAVCLPSVPVDKAQLAQVVDAKGDLGWAIHDPHGPLCLRMLSLEKAPPSPTFFAARFARAVQLRESVRSEKTTAYRLFNGEGDLLPGLVCDIYNHVAVLQFDGRGPGEFWPSDQVADWLLANVPCRSVVEKNRRQSEKNLTHLAGEPCADEILISENGVLFRVNIERGQKTGFFLDQRDNREFVASISRGKSTLNLFSYSGGFSVYAGLGQASRVASVDSASAVVVMANDNWTLNGLPPERHVGHCADVFEFLKTHPESWDHVIVDPPSMSHAEEQRAVAKEKYIELFAAAARRVTPKADGRLSLSSCSSHITYDDFFEIITEALSQARRRGVILRVSGQGPDHPFPHVCPELRYLKFVHLVLV